jgi:hypothetical protein
MDVRAQLRQDDLARVLRLAPSERAQLALDLGDRSLELLCAARKLTRAEARAFVRQARERSRRPPP